MISENNPEQALPWLRNCQDDLRAKQDDLRTRLEQCERDLAAVDRSIEIAQERMSKATTSVDHNQSSYADLGPRWAVDKYFRERPGIAVKPSTLAKELIALGCKRTNSDNNVFVAQVRTACLRLTEKGLLEQTTLNGKVAFQLKKPRENQ